MDNFLFNTEITKGMHTKSIITFEEFLCAIPLHLVLNQRLYLMLTVPPVCVTSVEGVNVAERVPFT